MDDLKTKPLPCPFCGEHLQEPTKVANPYPGLARMHPGALDDGTCPLAGWGFYDEQLATWNTRTGQLIALPAEPDAAMVERVARALAVQDGYDPNETWQEFNRDAAATDLMCGGVPDEEIFPTYVRWKEYQSKATAACRAVLEHLRETGRG